MSTRTSLRWGGATLAAALVAGLAGGQPANSTPPPTPRITTVTAQLDALGRQSEQLAEKYNAATIALASVRARLVTAEHALVAATARRNLAQTQFVRLVQAEYEAGPGNAFGALMTSSSRRSYVEGQNYSDLAAAHAAAVISDFRDATAKAAAARAAQAQLVKAADAQVVALAADRAAVTARTAKLKALLASLTAAQQAAIEARDAATKAQQDAATATPTTAKKPTTSSTKSKTNKTKKKHGSGGSTFTVHAGNAAAQRAIDFALAQVGKPYGWGQAGPGSYDCSGLTMASWRRGGVHLPHLASSQYNYGHHVGWNELQPGDLIFLYSPIGHVEIYIGNGMAVSAPTTGQNVKIISIGYSRSDFAGATRLT